MLSAPSSVPDRLDVDAPAQQALHEFTVLRATALGSLLPLSLPDTPRAWIPRLLRVHLQPL